MASSLLSIPPSILAYSLIPFIDEPKDLLSLRATCKEINKILHESEESEDIWIHFLSRDFHFITNTSTNTSSNTTTTTSNDPNGITYYLNTLRIDSDDSAHPNDDESIDPLLRDCEVSIFGFHASNIVYVAKNAYESWRQWNLAKRIYYEGFKYTHNMTFNATYFLRAAMMWSQIESWCIQNVDDQRGITFGRRVLSSLLPGVTFEKGRFNDCVFTTDNPRSLQMLPGIHAFGAIFAFYNGQNAFCEAGIIGGYHVYNNSVSMNLSIPGQCRHFPPTKKVISSNGYETDVERLIHLNCENGQIYLFKSDPWSGPPIPKEDIPMSKPSKDDKYDAGLVWMENLANKLEKCEIELVTCNPFGRRLHHTYPDRPRTIVHYPTIKCKHQFYNDNDSTNPLPIVSHIVTNGIEVIASTHYDPLEKHYVSYNIRMKILGEGDEGYLPAIERGYRTCQLLSRHWTIVSDDGSEETVNGEGVVGMFPVLLDGGYMLDQNQEDGYFRYSSYVNAESKSFSGQLRFVPGSIHHPTGDPFFVDVAPFAIVTKQDIMY